MTVTFRVQGRSVPGSLDFTDAAIVVRFSFNRSLIDEIQSMEGARWHPEQKCWSVANNIRNQFQLDFLTGKNPYDKFDIPYLTVQCKRKLYAHQIVEVQHILTRHGCLIAAEMGTGKTLAAIEAIEQAGVDLPYLKYTQSANTMNLTCWNQETETEYPPSS